MKKKLSPDQLSLIFQGHLGLIVGPGLTLGSGAVQDVSAAVATAFGVPTGATYLDTCDAALTQGHSPDAVRGAVTKAIGARQPAPLSSRLARVRWGAVLSFTPDLALEDHIRSEANKNAFRPPGFVIDAPNVAIPPRAVPLLKILGTVGRETLVVSKYEYAKARPRWRTGLRAFLDLIKDAPVLCLGMTELPWALADILGELGSSSTFISRFVVLEDDALVQSGEIDRMLDPRTELVTSRGAAGDLVQAAEAGLMIPNAISPQPLTTAVQEPLRAYGDIALVVSPSTAVKKEERQQLFEMLFAPTSVHWAPFVHKLDLERTLAQEVVDELDGHLSTELPGSIAVVEGAAATGKTVLLKRVALDLASKGHLVLWVRPYFYPDVSARIDQLFKALAKVAKRGVCLVQDDPYALGSLNLKELGAVARSNDVPAKFLVGMRSSDWSTRQPADLLGPLKLFHTFHLSDSLDDGEWGRLEAYLQTLGVARTPAEARQQLAGTATRSARDTLSMLYGLVPETRAHIQQSITQEYFRLGDQAGFQRVVLGQAQHSSDLLKRAYEMVAVADRYRAFVPIEVLVSALGVDYRAWLVATDTAHAAWGLFYAEENKEAETIVYRTRNDVVSRVLIEALNGGSLSRSGEVRVLRTMLDACTGSHPSYREFCERVLAGNDALKELEYADGLELYDRALKALPYADKAIIHHKGIWMRTKGSKPLEALKVFDEALRTEPAPYARRFEADEHIYTSSAAAIIDAMKDGLLSVGEGKERALTALARSRSGSFFNASAVHVYANLVLKLSQRLGIETPDAKHLAATALADVDRTVLVLEGNPAREAGEDVAMLRQVRDSIVLKTVDPKEARARADDLWDSHQNQDGFCLAARALLHTARTTGKGSAFKSAFEYCSECIERIRKAGANPVAALHDARLQTLYEWRIHAWRHRTGAGFINWETFYDDVIRVRPTDGAVALYRYFEGLALSHLNKWNEASGAFAQIRQARVPADLLWSRRDILLDPKGDPRELQGTVRRVNERGFVHVDELSTDFMADRDAKWPKHGEITTCFVEFAFGGWTAIPRRP